MAAAPTDGQLRPIAVADAPWVPTVVEAERHPIAAVVIPAASVAADRRVEVVVMLPRPVAAEVTAAAAVEAITDTGKLQI